MATESSAAAACRKWNDRVYGLRRGILLAASPTIIAPIACNRTAVQFWCKHTKTGKPISNQTGTLKSNSHRTPGALPITVGLSLG